MRTGGQQTPSTYNHQGGNKQAKRLYLLLAAAAGAHSRGGGRSLRDFGHRHCPVGVLNRRDVHNLSARRRWGAARQRGVAWLPAVRIAPAGGTRGRRRRGAVVEGWRRWQRGAKRRRWRGSVHIGVGIDGGVAGGSNSNSSAIVGGGGLWREPIVVPRCWGDRRRRVRPAAVSVAVSGTSSSVNGGGTQRSVGEGWRRAAVCCGDCGRGGLLLLLLSPSCSLRLFLLLSLSLRLLFLGSTSAAAAAAPPAGARLRLTTRRERCVGIRSLSIPRRRLRRGAAN